MKSLNLNKGCSVGDIHISARKISVLSVQKLAILGFVRDEFVNSTRCEVSEFHASYKGEKIIPNLTLWNELVNILKNDKNFEGGLEEEVFDPNLFKFVFKNSNFLKIPMKLPYIKINSVSKGKIKKCDIHININLSKSSKESIFFLDCLKITSFERMNKEELHRIYTVTMEDLKNGINLFKKLKEYLLLVPGLNGKIKFEVCSNFYRFPTYTPILPIIENNILENYLRDN